MGIQLKLGVGVAALIFASGCARSAKINSAHLAESGTDIVATPGALTVVRQGANSSRSCTLRTAGPGMGKHHGKKGKRGKGGPPPGAGPGPMLDVLLFRLCEARANNDMSAEQYATSVQMILKTMSDMAQRPPPRGPMMGGPGMGGPGMGRGPGMGGPGMGRGGWDRGGWDRWGRSRRDFDRRDDAEADDDPSEKGRSPGGRPGKGDDAKPKEK